MKSNRKIISFSFIIALLNVFDGVATNYGLKQRQIEELNPVMNSLWHMSPSLFILVKIILSILLICLSVAVYNRSNKRFQQIFFSILSGLLLLYGAIFCLHVYWLTMIF
ncbi:MAG: DUF5658 family protein [Solibacillus sp.]|uniref:DUF5658 family protein n=1 Tax=unclassified Solibacillus TaxID=2637870 RepID=UPI0030FAC861